MSRQLTITAPGLSTISASSNTQTRPMTGTDGFSEIPSDTFTQGWILYQANLSVRVWSKGSLFSGDVWVKLTNTNGVTTSSAKIKPYGGQDYERDILPQVKEAQGDFTNVTIDFSSSIVKEIGFSGLQIYYLGLPYNFSLNNDGHGTAGYSHSENSDTSILVTATPNKGYKFSHWSDGSTANPYHFDPGSEVTDVTLTANFTPIQYTVEYYDCTSGNEVLYGEPQICSYDAPYDTLSLPSFEGSIPTGYYLNPIGWTREKNANIRYGTEEIYLGDHSTLVTQYTTFSNLTDVDGAVIKMYFCLYPYSYTVNYIQYSKNSTDEANSTTLPTEYRIFNGGDYTLTALPGPSTGYKLTNQMQKQQGPVDTSLTNSWFTSSDAMKPGDPTISFIPSAYADNIVLYSYEVLLNYIVNFYKFTIDTEELLEQRVWEYGITYDLPALPTIEPIPEGYATNPTGWVSTKSGSIRNGTLDMYSGTSTTTTLTQLTSDAKYSTEDQTIYNFYFGLYPIQYLVNYKKYIEGSSNNYTPDTDYRIYNLNDYTLKSLPEATTGYKLTNKMHNIKEQIDSTITNSWFTSSEAMQPGDPAISSIAATTAQDVTVYSYETPIDYEVYFHIYNYDNSEITFTSQWYKYKENVVMPSEPISRPGRVPFGWYRGEQNIESWRVLVNSSTENTVTTNTVALFNETIKESLTDKDFDQVHLYTYYLPKTYLISYEWDDDYSKDLIKYPLPDSQEIIYGKNDYTVPVIPNYSNYIINDADTISWYYYSNNNKNTPKLINEDLVISKFLLENIVFYACRIPKPRYINFYSNNNFGTGYINKSTPNQDGYLENTLLEVYAQPLTPDTAFLAWRDTEDRNPIRQILVTDENADYNMIFRNESVTKGIVDLYKGSTRLESVYMGDNIQFINQPYVYIEPTYTFKNLSTAYKFTYDNTTGYYVSGNAGQSNSWSLCQIDIDSKIRCLMHVDCINNAEPNCDFGILSKLNEILSNSSSTDTIEVSQMIFNTSDKHKDDIQTVTYEIPKGISSIQIKYKKDGGVNSNSDSLKFKIRFEEGM